MGQSFSTICCGAGEDAEQQASLERRQRLEREGLDANGQSKEVDLALAQFKRHQEFLASVVQRTEEQLIDVALKREPLDPEDIKAHANFYSQHLQDVDLGESLLGILQSLPPAAAPSGRTGRGFDGAGNTPAVPNNSKKTATNKKNSVPTHNRSNSGSANATLSSSDIVERLKPGKHLKKDRELLRLVASEVQKSISIFKIREKEQSLICSL